MNIDKLLEKDVLPDWVIRWGIRNLLKRRLAGESNIDMEKKQDNFRKLLRELRQSPIAINTKEANEQHYELPVSFFSYVLGKYMKYSCGYWDNDIHTLDEAEHRMLQLSLERSGVKDNQNVLELGGGWGSFSLYAARKYPRSFFTVMSNSGIQIQFIENEAKKRGIKNLQAVHADINDFDPGKAYDRILSIEMFEHMRNYKLLLKKISSSLKPDGKLFVHIFCHRELAYKFEIQSQTDWMARYFFTGGIMPSDHLLFYFNDHLQVADHWHVNGVHYEKTLRKWREKMESKVHAIEPIFANTYGPENVRRWWVYWRVFFMACEELFNYNKGNEWFVSHYLLEKKK